MESADTPIQTCHTVSQAVVSVLCSEWWSRSMTASMVDQNMTMKSTHYHQCTLHHHST